MKGTRLRKVWTSISTGQSRRDYSTRRGGGGKSHHVNPILLGVSHSTTAGNLACRSGFVERTGTRTVTEGLGSVAALTRIPLINNHLDRHLASPNAARALFLVGSCCKSPMTEFLLGVGQGAHARHQFRAGDTVSADALPVVDPRLETVEFYKIGNLKVRGRESEEERLPPPWCGVPPPLAVYRERSRASVPTLPRTVRE